MLWRKRVGPELHNLSRLFSFQHLVCRTTNQVVAATPPTLSTLEALLPPGHVLPTALRQPTRPTVQLAQTCWPPNDASGGTQRERFAAAGCLVLMCSQDQGSGENPLLEQPRPPVGPAPVG